MVATLEYRLTGGSSNADPDESLGGVGSSVSVSGTAANNLFDNVYPTDTVSGEHVSYRAFDIYNSGDATAGAVEFYLTDTTNSESELYVWLDVTGTQDIESDDIEPSGASGNWTQPLVDSKMSLGDLVITDNHRMWIRRTVDQLASNINDDTGTLHTWYA